MAEPDLVYIVDDDPSIRNLVEATVRAAGFEVRAFASAEDFLAAPVPNRPACLLLDLELPGASGLDLLEGHFRGGSACPVIIVTGKASVQRAVVSMKLGAIDFLEKPFDRAALLNLVRAAVKNDRKRREEAAGVREIQHRLATLSARERELLAALIAGKSTKMIADRLALSARTVDHHRANLMEKMNAANVADLVRMALQAGAGGKP